MPRTQSNSPVAVGVSDHRGWAVLVSVAPRKGEPHVVDRRRVELIDPGLPTQPHHHEGADLPASEVAKLLRSIESSVAARSREALEQLRADLAPQQIVAVALEAAPVVPASLEEILSSQSSMVAADALLYRGAFSAAAEALGFKVAHHARRTELSRAAQVLGDDAERVEQLLAEARSELGAPWTKEHRLAAAAAIAGLAGHAKMRLPTT